MIEQLRLEEYSQEYSPPPLRGHGRFEHYGPWPGGANGYYSHFVVWKAVLAWTLDDWVRARRGAA